jgi:hypothetical protein
MKTLLSLFNALLSAAVLFLASRSGARSRGNRDAVLGLRLPLRLLLCSFSGPSPLRSEPSVGSGLEAGAPFESLLCDVALSDGSGVGRLAAEAVAPLIAGSCGPCSGTVEAGGGGACCWWCWACSAMDGARDGGVAMYC